MTCPACHHAHTRVYDTKPTREGRVNVRRRRCRKCGHKFITRERQVLNVLHEAGENRNAV
jgi:transcriptional repressor NrdR